MLGGACKASFTWNTTSTDFAHAQVESLKSRLDEEGMRKDLMLVTEREHRAIIRNLREELGVQKPSYDKMKCVVEDWDEDIRPLLE